MGREWGGGGKKQGNSVSERWSELRKHADERQSGTALGAECFAHTPLDRSGNELVDASANGIEMVIKAN